MIYFKKALTFLVGMLFFLRCTEPGHYLSVNPPVNGVVIEGSANQNLSGYQTVSLQQNIPNCNNECYVGMSNNVFITVAGAFKEDLQKDTTYAFKIKADNSEIYYLYYKDQNGDLARDTKIHQNGILPEELSSNSFLSFINNGKENITDRGVIYIEHQRFQFYFQLKNPITSSIEVCYGELEKENLTPTLQTLKNMLCFNKLNVTE